MGPITNFLLTQGILGICVLVLALVVIKLYNKNEKLQEKIDNLQEARRLDAVETRTDVTSVLPGISQTLQNIYDKIEVSKQSKNGKQ